MITHDMSDKTCLLTGATNSIGKVIAQTLAERGAHTVIVGRDVNKTNKVVNEIRAASHNANVEMIIADLSVLSDIRHVADEFKSHHDRLDVLVNNAGAIFMNREETPDGLEKTFALNHLGYFLLTNLLLDTLKQSASARIVSTSSKGHSSAAKLDFEDLPYRHKSYNGFAAYNESKLCNILFTYELSRRLEGTHVTANCLHPGVIVSGWGKDQGLLISAMKTLLIPFAISKEEGAQTSLYLATSPEVEGVTGKYFRKSHEVPSSRYSYDPAASHQLWALSEKLVG
jgi:NAD(P)-dependent dehydrogenase (short-subunit alcohol dehydrogenase family)